MDGEELSNLCGFSLILETKELCRIFEINLNIFPVFLKQNNLQKMWRIEGIFLKQINTLKKIIEIP